VAILAWLQLFDKTWWMVLIGSSFVIGGATTLTLKWARRAAEPYRVAREASPQGVVTSLASRTLGGYTYWPLELVMAIAGGAALWAILAQRPSFNEFFFPLP